MFDHVKFGVSDYAASKAFFLKALEPLGVSVVSEGPPTYGVELSAKGKASLCLYQTGEKPAHLHLAFTAENRQQVEAFYRAAMEAGGRDNGAPGLCPDYHANYYAAFVIGPDGTTSKWFVTNPRPNQSMKPTSVNEDTRRAPPFRTDFSVCHDTLPWLISFSLDASDGLVLALRNLLHDCRCWRCSARTSFLSLKVPRRIIVATQRAVLDRSCWNRMERPWLVLAQTSERRSNASQLAAVLGFGSYEVKPQWTGGRHASVSYAQS